MGKNRREKREEEREGFAAKRTAQYRTRNLKALGILSALMELVIVSATTSWPIRSSKTCGLYFNANTLELIFI